MKKLLSIVTLLLSFLLSIHAQEITEIHYDNVGDDVNEFVEVFIPEGDVNIYAIVLYNGNTRRTYDTDVLPSTCPTGAFNVVNCDVTETGESGCFFTINYPLNGIQNGAPDGLALVRNPGTGSETVVEFISYEGTINIAADGPAAGQFSMDIGVEEGPTTATGTSMQVTSNGWETGLGETPGDCNEVFLPVTLTSFTAYLTEAFTVLIDWATESEVNNDYFDLEVSTNGIDFETLTSIDGQGTSYLSQSYSYRHKALTAATYYYRLKQVDFDGTSTYSTTVAVELDGKAGSALQLQPTLVEDQLNLRFPNVSTSTGQLQIFNVAGVQQHSMVIGAGEEAKDISTIGWEAGHYFVQLELGGALMYARFVKL